MRRRPTGAVQARVYFGSHSDDRWLFRIPRRTPFAIQTILGYRTMNETTFRSSVLAVDTATVIQIVSTLHMLIDQ